MTTYFRVDALNRREDVARFLSVVRRRLPGSLAVRSASCRQMRRSFRMAHRLATTTGSPFRLSASAGAQAKQSPRFRLYVVPPAADAGGAIPQPAWPLIRCKAGAKNERDDVSDRREHGPCPARARRASNSTRRRATLPSRVARLTLGVADFAPRALLSARLPSDHAPASPLAATPSPETISARCTDCHGKATPAQQAMHT